ncbi:MAG: MFS transporter [Anaerolineae bacterium]|nr:MFS transporter [Candidatus Roseilinea sp.]MDW8448615.1 MFS transporter [Anaerolineae bacterium]
MFRRFTYIARLYLVWVAIYYVTFAFPATLMNFYLEALGLDRAFIGLFHGASQFGGLILALPALLCFERMGRRAALVFGAAFASLARLPTVLVPVPEVILVAEALSGFGTVIFGLASVSLLADASTEDHRAALFGTGDFTRTVAVLLGSIAAGSLPALIAPLLQVGDQSAEAYRVVLVAAFVVRTLAVVPLAMIARCRPVQGEPTAALPDVRALRYLNPRVLLGQRLQVYALGVPFMLLLAAEALVFTFFNLLMRDRFGASDAQIGLIIGVNALIGSGAALFAPRFAEWMGYRPAIVWGSFATAAGVAAFALSSNLLLGALAVFIQVAVSQISRVLYRVYVVNVSLRDEYFIVSVVMAIAANIGPAVAPPASGLIQRTFSYAPLFAASIAMTVIAALLFDLIARWISQNARVAHRALAHSPPPAQRPSPRTPFE